MGIGTGRRIGWIAAVAIGVLLAARIVAADDARQPTKDAGHALARRLCHTCHLIGDEAAATAIVGIPTFRTIANRPGQTAERIRNILMRPHPPMPDMHLTDLEMQSILAYLESLRTNPDVPALSPGPVSPKPAYPEPS